MEPLWVFYLFLAAFFNTWFELDGLGVRIRGFTGEKTREELLSEIQSWSPKENLSKGCWFFGLMLVQLSAVFVFNPLAALGALAYNIGTRSVVYAMLLSTFLPWVEIVVGWFARNGRPRTDVVVRRNASISETLANTMVATKEKSKKPLNRFYKIKNKVTLIGFWYLFLAGVGLISS